jgi:hypothetical protein
VLRRSGNADKGDLLGHREVGTSVARRTVVVGLVVSLLFYLWIGFSKGEAFPFSTFPMYSVARLDPYIVPTQRIYGYSASGEDYIVADQNVRGRVRAMRRRIVLNEVQPAVVEAFAQELVARINAGRLTPEPVVGIRVIELRVQLRPHGDGDPLQPKVLKSSVLIDNLPPGLRPVGPVASDTGSHS